MARRPSRPTLVDLLLQVFRRLNLRTQVALLLTVVAVGVIVAGVWLFEQHRQEQQKSKAPPTVRQPLPGPSGTPPSPPIVKTPVSVQLTLGNPSGATADPSNRDNYLLIKPYFAMSYNASKGGRQLTRHATSSDYLRRAFRSCLCNSACGPHAA